MTLVEFVPPTPHPLWQLCPQMGITDVIVKVNPSLTGIPDPWRFGTLKSIVARLADAGLRVVGLEGDPFDMAPIKEFGAGACFNAETQRRRADTLAHYRELLESMGRLGIKLLCYNFMPGLGWSRTGVREGRGDAKATCFSLKETVGRVAPNAPLEAGYGDEASSLVNGAGDEAGCLVPMGAAARGDAAAVSSKPPYQADSARPLADAMNRAPPLALSHAQVWANYEYFIKAVMPTAERCGVRMALHPDDPCLPSLGGYARIFGSVESYDRAYAIYPSPSNAVTFCQANFKLMGAALAKTARHFGKRIAFIHVRDVEGTREDFTELFHDQGDVDQFALMRTYRETGLDVPVRGDHVPEMAFDRVLTPDGTPGYFTLGRLFANGYLKALLKGTGNDSRQ